MPSRASRPCTIPGCPNPTPTGRCPQHEQREQQRIERSRPNFRQRGYSYAGHEQRFRAGVLARDPVCVNCHTAPATVADHYPLDRRELLARSLDPDDPQHGRGLCADCHGKHTARAQPGGWNQP